MGLVHLGRSGIPLFLCVGNAEATFSFKCCFAEAPDK